MTAKFSRDELLRQLRDTLDLTGANPARWPENVRARLSALIECDRDAARLFAEAKALDTVMSRASGGAPRPELETRILAAAARLPQERAAAPSGVVSLERVRAQRRARSVPANPSQQSFWRGAALLAASLILGVFIGMSGQAISTLRNIELLAFNDSDLGISFSRSLFGSGGLEERGQL